MSNSYPRSYFKIGRYSIRIDYVVVVVVCNIVVLIMIGEMFDSPHNRYQNNHFHGSKLIN